MSTPLTAIELETLAASTIAHYDGAAQSFHEATRDHDVSQNYAAFLGAIPGPPPFVLLDFGCGPGRDLAYFRSLGHEAVGLDGSERFVQMARASTGCEVLHQNFLNLSLPVGYYRGIFANASLFHVPAQELKRVLGQLWNALTAGGVLFSSNPRGQDTEGFSGERYGAFHTLETWRSHLVSVRFTEVAHYYRPAGKPRSEQPWLATVWRKDSGPQLPIVVEPRHPGRPHDDHLTLNTLLGPVPKSANAARRGKHRRKMGRTRSIERGHVRVRMVKGLRRDRKRVLACRLG